MCHFLAAAGELPSKRGSSSRRLASNNSLLGQIRSLKEFKRSRNNTVESEQEEKAPATRTQPVFRLSSGEELDKLGEGEW